MDSRRGTRSDIERGSGFELGAFSGPRIVPAPAPAGNEDLERERGSNEEPNDFDDSANELWSLYGDVAKRHDEARIRALKEDMDGIPVYAGLISAVIAAFVVPKLQDLQVNPAMQSVYYQQQSTLMLVQISKQIASIDAQIPFNATPILPYPTFHPSGSDRLVAVFWLISLVFSLSAALLSALIQQWVRVYMRVYQRSRSPLKKARTRQYFFEGVERLPVVAEAAPGLVHLSLLFFLSGLASAVLNIDTVVGVAAVVPIAFCGYIYFYSVIAPITNPQTPYRNPFSYLVLLALQILLRRPYGDRSHPRGVWPAGMEARQEKLVMERPEERKALDVRAVRWLVDNVDGNNEMVTFILAIPGIFNKKWGREVWNAFSTGGNSQLDRRRAQLIPHSGAPVHPLPDIPCPPKGTTIGDLCRRVKYLFEIYSDEGDPMNKEAQRRCMQGCIETVASLVCCTDVRLEWFGDVREVLSDLGHTGGLSTIKPNASFTARWTCLALVAIRQMVTIEDKRVRELAGFVVGRIAQFQSDYGATDPETAALHGAERIDGCLEEAWEHVEDLRRAFEPWDENRDEEEIRNILNHDDCESWISELERIGNEAEGMGDVDGLLTLLLDAMDEATRKLVRQLPGMSFDKLKPSGPISMSEAFVFTLFGDTVITPQFIFPGQQVHVLCTLGRRLRDIIEERNPEKHAETVEDLLSIYQIPIPLRRPKDLIRLQLWRLRDLQDGGGLGFTIELLFLAIRQLSSTSLSSELKRIFYVGTFKVIAARREDRGDTIGTLGILLNLICDLVIKSRGVFSDFSYPDDIVEMLLELVEAMVKEHGNTQQHINDLIKDAVEDLLNISIRDCRDGELRDNALGALGHQP